MLLDVWKTLVYELAHWRNRHGEVIPQATLDKPPSAELRPRTTDTDSLPPYDTLDKILRAYIERDRSITQIVAEGFDVATVERVARMVDRNEYKRRQAAPGVKITTKALVRPQTPDYEWVSGITQEASGSGTRHQAPARNQGQPSVPAVGVES